MEELMCQSVFGASLVKYIHKLFFGYTGLLQFSHVFYYRIFLKLRSRTSQAKNSPRGCFATHLKKAALKENTN